MVPVAVIALALSRYDHAGVCKFGKVGLRSIHSHLESRRFADGEQTRAPALKQRDEGQCRQRRRDDNFKKREPGIAAVDGAIRTRCTVGHLNVRRQC